MNRFVCQNCGHICGQKDMHRTIADMPGSEIVDRVAPGEPMPGGECPECSGLMQPVVTKLGCVMVFKEGVTRPQVANFIEIADAGGILDWIPQVNEFDPEFGGPVWYIP
jgi:hypothetical protein